MKKYHVLTKTDSFHQEADEVEVEYSDNGYMFVTFANLKDGDPEPHPFFKIARVLSIREVAPKHPDATI